MWRTRPPHLGAHGTQAGQAPNDLPRLTCTRVAWRGWVVMGPHGLRRSRGPCLQPARPRVLPIGTSGGCRPADSRGVPSRQSRLRLDPAKRRWLTDHMLLGYLNDLLREAVGAVDPSGTIQTLRWEIPKDHSFGDLSSPVAFRLASQQRCAPVEVATRLAQLLQPSRQASTVGRLIERVEAKQGFVNLFLSQEALHQVLRRIRRVGSAYGAGRAGRGKSILIEFVSANPTGPLSVAHGRQAALGDALARVLSSQGSRVA